MVVKSAPNTVAPKSKNTPCVAHAGVWGTCADASYKKHTPHIAHITSQHHTSIFGAWEVSRCCDSTDFAPVFDGGGGTLITQCSHQLILQLIIEAPQLVPAAEAHA